MTSRILVADDSMTVRAALRSHLAQHEYTILEAEDGTEALAMIRAHRPDVVLLDIMMPGLDGHEVLAAVKTDERLADIPIIVLTVKSGVADVVEGLRRGAHDYLSKPFEPAELIARVNAALRTKALNDELRRRNEELEAFSLRVSHDLKSPLSVIKGIVLLLTRSFDRFAREERDGLLERIVAAADRSDRMVSDLLALTRQASVKPDVEASSNAAAAIHQVMSGANFPDAEIEVSGDWPAVRVATSDLTSVLSNLIENAHHYGRNDRGDLRLALSGEVNGSKLVIRIRDHGTGIEPDDANHVFDAFFRAASSLERNPRSTGVGLAIVRRTVERWGGTVEVESSSPHGTVFRLALPLAQAPAGIARGAGTEVSDA